MALDAGVLHNLTKGSAADAWRVIIDKAVEIASKPLAAGNAPSEVTKRDREIGALDHFLSSSGWDLWQTFGQPEISGVEAHLGSLGALVERALQRQGSADPRRPFTARIAVADSGRQGTRLHPARGHG